MAGDQRRFNGLGQTLRLCLGLDLSALWLSGGGVYEIRRINGLIRGHLTENMGRWALVVLRIPLPHWILWGNPVYPVARVLFGGLLINAWSLERSIM